MTQRDKTSKEILVLLQRRGWKSYRAIDNHFNLPKGIACFSAHKPHASGEAALTKALNLSPVRIWPSRYDLKTGKRLSPCPAENSRQPKARRHRQNGAKK